MDSYLVLSNFVIFTYQTRANSQNFQLISMKNIHLHLIFKEWIRWVSCISVDYSESLKKKTFSSRSFVFIDTPGIHLQVIKASIISAAMKKSSFHYIDSYSFLWIGFETPIEFELGKSTTDIRLNWISRTKSVGKWVCEYIVQLVFHDLFSMLIK